MPAPLSSMQMAPANSNSQMRVPPSPDEPTFSTSFTSKPFPRLFPAQNQGHALAIKDYIPLGCLRLHRPDFAIDTETWWKHRSWIAFAHPRDIYSFGGIYIAPEMQERFFESAVMNPYRGLHTACWIRLEFSSQSQDLGLVRVFILPDDVGRSSIDRYQKSLRKAMQHLLARVDISPDVWNQEWSPISPMTYVDRELDEQERDTTTLFKIFNELPSPDPDPESVGDPYVKDAMCCILQNHVDGVETKMHLFQTRTAAIMLQRESQPELLLDPRLRELEDQNGITYYCDTDAGYCLRDPRMYEAGRGGICAETMGLGKTLICLALIAATRHIPSKIPEGAPTLIPSRPTTGSLMQMAAAAVNRTSRPWKHEYGHLRGDGSHLPKVIEALDQNPGFYYLASPPRRRQSRNPVEQPPRKIYLTAATLVVVPANLVQQWEFEIKKHAKDLTYYASANLKTGLPSAAKLATFDIILLSKPCFEKEARDGMDGRGRRTTNKPPCQCPYIGSTRIPDCTCVTEDMIHRSPLKDLLFKRIITDEGHTFGNASKAVRTEAMTVIDFLQVGARWIVSGTPTQGLYGVETSTDGVSYPQASPTNSDFSISTTSSKESQASETIKEQEQEHLMYQQERKDLEKLGNIATTYLKIQPWVNRVDSQDCASWSQLVMQPRHGRKSHGNMKCLKATMEGMIVRHQTEDVMAEILLPPLHHKAVRLDGSIYDKMSLNLFSLMIVSNAVTSERKDADYLFHPRRKTALQSLFMNLRQASFFWSGYSADDLQSTLDISRRFLEKKQVPVSPDDERLLKQAINIGEAILEDKLFIAASTYHEIPMYVQLQGCGGKVKRAWSLNEEDAHPTLMGTSMIFEMQKFVDSKPKLPNPWQTLETIGKAFLRASKAAQEAQPAPKYPKKRKHEEKALGTNPSLRSSSSSLSGGVKIGNASTPRKPVNSQTKRIQAKAESKVEQASKDPGTEVAFSEFDPEFLDSSIISTASSKLSYLVDQITLHQANDKIIVFYEADNVAYYIAQVLESLQVQHLIYAKSLSSERRATYVVTFNRSEKFRVLLMDVSQAAFGLDLSCASRIFFLNPVFSPQIELQAMKRAHRIGQTKPVFVETLVLAGSIEEEILERRKTMSTEEHKACKTILDDKQIYEWVRNVRFIHMGERNLPSDQQVAQLQQPQTLFGRGARAISDPDADLVLEADSPSQIQERKLEEAKHGPQPKYIKTLNIEGQFIRPPGSKLQPKADSNINDINTTSRFLSRSGAAQSGPWSARLMAREIPIVSSGAGGVGYDDSSSSDDQVTEEEVEKAGPTAIERLAYMYQSRMNANPATSTEVGFWYTPNRHQAPAHPATTDSSASSSGEPSSKRIRFSPDSDEVPSSIQGDPGSSRQVSASSSNRQITNLPAAQTTLQSAPNTQGQISSSNYTSTSTSSSVDMSMAEPLTSRQQNPVSTGGLWSALKAKLMRQREEREREES